MDDPVATAQRQLAGWKELRPDVQVIELKGLAHYPHIEDPKRFVDEVLLKVLRFKDSGED
jgi:pimeloyl-ACP methyl ester carboxylesterase